MHILEARAQTGPFDLIRPPNVIGLKREKMNIWGYSVPRR